MLNKAGLEYQGPWKKACYSYLEMQHDAVFASTTKALYL